MGREEVEVVARVLVLFDCSEEDFGVLALALALALVPGVVVATPAAED